MDTSISGTSEDQPIAGGGEAILVLITAASQEEADKIARSLVAERLAACVNILPEVRSLFSWENKLSEEKEALLVVKSRRPLFRQMVRRVKALHSYTVPEIIAIPIVEGSVSYLQWIQEVTGTSPPTS
jgi:periplasmic divalent cation tolerance protein